MKLDRDENGGSLTARDIWNLADHQPIQLVFFDGEQDLDGKTVFAKSATNVYPLQKVTCSDYTNGPVYVFRPNDLCEECGKQDTCKRENFWNMGTYLALEGQWRPYI